MKVEQMSGLQRVFNGGLDYSSPVEKVAPLNEESLRGLSRADKKAIKKGAEYETDSYEDIIIRIDENADTTSKLKKEIKKRKEAISKSTTDKVTSLTNEEIHDLLVRKWIMPICDEIDNIPNLLLKKLLTQVIFHQIQQQKLGFQLIK